MKRVMLTTTLCLLLLGGAYIVCYRTSHLRPTSSGGTLSYQIVIAGVGFPHNEANKRIFSFLFGPLIDDAVADLPTVDAEGVISRIDFAKSELVILFASQRADGTGGIKVTIPKSFESSLTGFSQGDNVRITYGGATTDESPFGWAHELRSIIHLNQR